MYYEFANVNGLRVGPLDDEEAPIRILRTDDIIEANELLIQYMFPWADGIITKPSGDMAYEAVASGAFQLFLEPWGEWENNIEERFTKIGTGRKLNVKHFNQEFEKFRKHYWEGETWFSYAKSKVFSLPKQYLEGSKNILRVYDKMV